MKRVLAGTWLSTVVENHHIIVGAFGVKLVRCEKGNNVNKQETSASPKDPLHAGAVLSLIKLQFPYLSYRYFFPVVWFSVATAGVFSYLVLRVTLASSLLCNCNSCSHVYCQ